MCHLILYGFQTRHWFKSKIHSLCLHGRIPNIRHWKRRKEIHIVMISKTYSYAVKQICYTCNTRTTTKIRSHRNETKRNESKTVKQPTHNYTHLQFRFAIPFYFTKKCMLLILHLALSRYLAPFILSFLILFSYVIVVVVVVVFISQCILSLSQNRNETLSWWIEDLYCESIHRWRVFVAF